MSGQREGGDGEELFSREERAALDAWRPPEVPGGFADGVMAAWGKAPASGAAVVTRRQPFGGLAVAAVALLLLGGFFSVRSLVAGGDGAGPGGEVVPGFTAQDGGPGPEVRTPQLEGGSELQPS